MLIKYYEDIKNGDIVEFILYLFTQIWTYPFQFFNIHSFFNL
jgi:hypothetical protein